MSLSQYPVDDLFTPSLIDGGVLNFETNLPSPDFFLTDSLIDEFFPTSFHQSKSPKYDFIQQNKKNDFSQHQENIFPELDLSDIDLDNFTDLLNDPLNDDSLDIGKFISEVSFSSPVTSSEYSPSSNDGSYSEELSMNTDRIVPPSPSTSSMTTRKSKLDPVQRKIRKKTQNKNAAEKYRIKKKSERDHLIDRHTHLKSVNQDLKIEFENLAYQVQQLKQLLVDVVQVPLPFSK